MQINDYKLTNEALLLKRFNSRKPDAFSEMYNLYYKDFHYYTASLYDGCGVDSDDIIQDMFLELWQKKDIVFDHIIKVKAFIIIAIKNGYKNYVRSQKIRGRYDNLTAVESQFKFDVIETEIYSIVNHALNLLPKDCADVFRLYLEGWKPDEIAVKLNKKPQTIYNKKTEAIAILRKKISKDKIFLLISIIH